MNCLDLFVYDETSESCLRWKVTRYTGRKHAVVSVFEGDVAGAVNGKGYYSVEHSGKAHRVHRVVWEIHRGPIPAGMQIDHINAVKTDNRIQNLRLVTNTVNARNRRISKVNKSGVTGIVHRIRTVRGYYEESFIALWSTLNGKQKSKGYSVVKYGFDEAFRLACEYRVKMIEQLNAEGAGYTDRHGQEK